MNSGISWHYRDMIDRTHLRQIVQKKLDANRVVALIGPRQCGKTTLAREFVSPSSVNYFDLEDPLSLALLDQPMTASQDLPGLVVIDEIHRRPDLFPVLRILADRNPLPARFLILGSASPELLRQSSESLAGRISTISMRGFSLEEVGAQAQSTLWRRGGFPLSFTATSEEASLEWRKDFVSTFLERDIPQFGFSIPSTSLFRFWSLLAHYHGHVWNAAEAARTLNISEGTARRYVDYFTTCLWSGCCSPGMPIWENDRSSLPKCIFVTRVCSMFSWESAPNKNCFYTRAAVHLGRGS